MTACTVVEVNKNLVLFKINKAVYNATSEHSLLSEYQLRDFGIKVNSIAKRHTGEQNLIVDDQEIPCDVKNCLVYFKYHAPMDEGLSKMTPIVLSQGEVSWNPRAKGT